MAGEPTFSAPVDAKIFPLIVNPAKVGAEVVNKF